MSEIGQLLVAAAVVTNGYIYYSIKNGRGLYRYNFQTDSNELMGMFEAYKGIEVELYNYAFLWDNKIFFAPKNAQTTGIYDLDNQVIKYDSDYNDMLKYFYTKKESLYYTNKVLGDYVYVVGLWDDTFIYKMDMRSKSGYEMPFFKKLSNKWLSLRNCCWEGDNCFVPSPDEDGYYQLNVSSGLITFIGIPPQIHAIHALLKIDDTILGMGGVGGNLFRLNKHNKSIEEIFNYVNDNIKDGTRYAHMEFVGRRVYLIPEDQSIYKLAVYDIDEKSFKELEGERKNDLIYPIGKFKDRLLLYSQTYNEFVILQGDNTAKRFSIRGDRKYLVSYIPWNETMEDNVWSLKEFINNL